MREIKFRAWSKRGLRFWYFDYTKGFNAENNDCFTDPMQYTGLKDKNGVEIYESDILEIQYEDGSLHGVVKWVDARFITEGVGDTEGYPHEFTSYFAKLCRVRGNIYESPQLLEQTK